MTVTPSLCLVLDSYHITCSACIGIVQVIQHQTCIYVWKSSILSIYSEICIHIMACKGEPYMYISCIISHGIR